MVELLRAAQTQASATFKPFEMYMTAVISMVELLRAAQTQASATFKPFEMYMTAGVIYLLLTTIFIIIFKKIEERLALSE